MFLMIYLSLRPSVNHLYKFVSSLMLENSTTMSHCLQNKHGMLLKGVVSKETVVLRWWGSSIQKFGFINGVDNVNWPLYWPLYGGQFTLSTLLIKPNLWDVITSLKIATKFSEIFVCMIPVSACPELSKVAFDLWLFQPRWPPP